MPSLRFVCEDWFETTVECPQVPRTGERVLLSEGRLEASYQVGEVTWQLVNGKAQVCVLKVERERYNPCTKCHGKADLKPVEEPDQMHVVMEIVGWECSSCNYPLHHDGKQRPVYTGPSPVDDPNGDKMGCGH
jgi:hypothetical protein